MGLNDLVETEAFLNILHSCQHDKIAAGVSLRETLQQALYIDGYVLHKLDIQRSLRGLAESSESSGGGVNVTALLMVGLCILCAGFASGLTQVLDV